MDNPSNDLSTTYPAAPETREEHFSTNSSTKTLMKDTASNLSQCNDPESNGIEDSLLLTKTSALKELKKEYTDSDIPGCIMSNDYLPLLSIPYVALEKILSYLSYDQVAQMRIISKR